MHPADRLRNAHTMGLVTANPQTHQHAGPLEEGCAHWRVSATGEAVVVGTNERCVHTRTRTELTLRAEGGTANRKVRRAGVPPFHQESSVTSAFCRWHQRRVSEHRETSFWGNTGKDTPTGFISGQTSKDVWRRVRHLNLDCISDVSLIIFV